MCLHGRGEIPPPSPSKPEAGRKASPQVIGAGELPVPSPALALRTVAHTPCLESTIELVLKA